MNRRKIPGMVFLLVAIIFAFLGFRAAPPNHAYIGIGVAFAIISSLLFRRARTP